jgi:hypothetical protein
MGNHTISLHTPDTQYTKKLIFNTTLAQLTAWEDFSTFSTFTSIQPQTLKKQLCSGLSQGIQEGVELNTPTQELV